MSEGLIIRVYQSSYFIIPVWSYVKYPNNIPIVNSLAIVMEVKWGECSSRVLNLGCNNCMFPMFQWSVHTVDQHWTAISHVRPASEIIAETVQVLQQQVLPQTEVACTSLMHSGAKCEHTCSTVGGAICSLSGRYNRPLPEFWHRSILFGDCARRRCQARLPWIRSLFGTCVHMCSQWTEWTKSQIQISQIQAQDAQDAQGGAGRAQCCGTSRSSTWWLRCWELVQRFIILVITMSCNAVPQGAYSRC